MVIYLKHPIHGTKVAISEVEAEYDMENGWEKFTHEEKIAQPIAISSAESEISVKDVKPRRRRKSE